MKMVKALKYRGQLYKMSMPSAKKPTYSPYTLQVQPPKSKPLQEIKRLLFNLLGRSPDKLDEDLGAVEFSWGCKSEEECQKHVKVIHKQLPGAIVDYQLSP